MKTGIWGAGNIAHTHAEALLAAGITVAAIVDAVSYTHLTLPTNSRV